MRVAYNAYKVPKFKPKGMLERTAIADLWKHTLSRIPSLYGRLVYLASLRDPNSGTYRHHGLAAAFGREESAKALRESHERTFAEWLALPLRGKAEDLKLYLSELDEPWGEVATHWLKSGEVARQLPSAALPMERDLFQQDIETLLKTLRNAGKRSQGSSTP